MSYMIEPKCPRCGATVKVNIHKVDRLEDRVKYLENENAELRKKIRVLELMKDTGKSPLDSFMDAMRGGK